MTHIIAHGIGERGDLPLPLYLFTWAMVLALVISFVALGVLWTEPRLARAAEGRALATRHTMSALRLYGRTVGLALYGLGLYAAFFGLDDKNRNILPVMFYVVLWVGAQVIGGLFGDIWGAINPIATLARGAERIGRLAGRETTDGPDGLGHWPAAFGMLIFLFYELSHPSGATPRTLGWLILVHAIITVVTGFLWGQRWVVEHEPFTVFFAKLGAMAPLYGAPRDSDSDSDSDGDGDSDGGLRLRAPMSGLAAMPVQSGTVALILVAIGGTSFDGFSESELGRSVFGDSFGWGLAWLELVGLTVSIGIVALLYVIGIWWTTRVTDISFTKASREFAPSLVPIAFGYALAHYFQLLSDETQTFVFRLSDPLGQGWDLFGGADGLVWRIDPTVVAWVQVAGILFGHIGAVTVAHDRAIEIFPVGKSLQSQFAMLFVMVGYSSLGLWLLLTA